MLFCRSTFPSVSASKLSLRASICAWRSLTSASRSYGYGGEREREREMLLQTVGARLKNTHFCLFLELGLLCLYGLPLSLIGSSCPLSCSKMRLHLIQLGLNRLQPRREREGGEEKGREELIKRHLVTHCRHNIQCTSEKNPRKSSDIPKGHLFHTHPASPSDQPSGAGTMRYHTPRRELECHNWRSYLMKSTTGWLT